MSKKGQGLKRVRGLVGSVGRELRSQVEGSLQLVFAESRLR
jgi:hypothetical protein